MRKCLTDVRHHAPIMQALAAKRVLDFIPVPHDVTPMDAVNLMRENGLSPEQVTTDVAQKLAILLERKDEIMTKRNNDPFFSEWEISKRTQAMLVHKMPHLDIGAMWAQHLDEVMERPTLCTACGSPFPDLHSPKCPTTCTPVVGTKE